MKVAAGPARAELVEHGWRTFLVKVRNEAGVTAPLRVSSPQRAARLLARPARLQHGSAAGADDLGRRRRRPLARPRDCSTSRRSTPTLSGLAVEYRILQLYVRDAGQREATLAADVGQGSQDIGFRNDAPILFTAQAVGRRDAARARRARPADRRAPFVIRDAQRPRLPVAGQAAGARLRLPPAGLPRRRRDGAAAPRAPTTSRSRRGPEYVPQRQRVTVGREPPTRERRADALDRPAGARLVLRRPPHPRRRLPALRDARPRASSRAT